jgi:Relaxase/Mobilisation nuclease domain
MIVKVLSAGKSFSGLATYLTHDPEAKTDERVAWTHTLNLAHDHVPSAVDEMLWTARNAELLKQEAGIRAGGRTTENTVKHISLNWSPDESPSRDHMIETAEGFLGHMKWQEHQALFVAHEDKAHAHVHLMLNMIHPETGLRLNDDFEHRRAQKWALGYEREQGRIYCEQRLLNPEEREKNPTRQMWMAFSENQKIFEAEEKNLENQQPIYFRDLEFPENSRDKEWKTLKEMQRDERLDFFSEGKSAFSELRKSIYREIRDEFRPLWKDFYALQWEGTDGEVLAALKAGIVAEQTKSLEMRRDEACAELRQTRDAEYRELLDGQRDARLNLRERQEAGFDNSLFLERIGDGRDRDITKEFGEAGDAATAPMGFFQPWEMEDDAFTGSPKAEGAGAKSAGDIGTGLAEGLGFGLISFLEGIAGGPVGPKPEAKPRRAEPEHPEPSPFDAIIKETRQREQQEKEAADEEWRKRQRSYGE